MSLESLYAKQKLHAKAFDNFMVNFNKTGKAKQTIGYCVARQNILDKYWTEFQTTHFALMEVATAEDVAKYSYFVENKYDTIECLYAEIAGILIDKINSAKSFANTSDTDSNDNSSNIGAKVSFQLPNISVPTFTGKYNEWSSFRDLFVSIIHSNGSLTNVQKLHYLKTNVSGDAANLLQNVTLVDANYKTAWDSLKNRYENEKLIINSHLDRLMSVPKMKEESVSAIIAVLDGTQEAVRALKNLKRPVKSWDDWLVYITVRKLDQNTRKDWENAIGSSADMPGFDELCNFLEVRLRTLESIDSSKPANKSTTTTPKAIKSHNAKISKCSLCSRTHKLLYCQRFREKSVQERREIAAKEKVCFNCLGNTHFNNDCPSDQRCHKCSQRHHTLLHLDHTGQHGSNNSATYDESSPSSTSINKCSPPSNNKSSSTSINKCLPPSATPINNYSSPSSSHQSTSTSVSSHFAHRPLKSSQVLLATAKVIVMSPQGNSTVLRALIDSGSQATLITESAVQLLKMKRMRMNHVPITGIGEASAGHTTGSVCLTIKSLIDQSFSVQINAYVMTSLTSCLPNYQFVPLEWDHLKDLPLADPSYFIPAKIDLIIGADIYNSLLCNGLKKGPQGAPVAQKTHLGWILSGPLLAAGGQENAIQSHNVIVDNIQIDEQLRKFWELEDVGHVRMLSADEQLCEQHYQQTHARAGDGRYTVRLPLKSSIIELGDSYGIAATQLNRLCNRFLKNTVLHKEYNKFINEYVVLGHMHAVSHDHASTSTSFYMPHHAVLKESSTSTKLRVVFNASQATTNGKSLNDHLLIGPKLQQDLTEIIMRWRTHFVVFVSDIQKMYRQINVDTRDTSLQRILWRDSGTNNTIAYELSTVTYGTSCAPYLAIRTLQQLAADEAHRYPLASKAIMRDFYVDDVLSGADDEENALALQKELIQIMSSGKFELRKWSSNRESVLQAVPEDFREGKLFHELMNDDCLKTLGVYWQPTSDTFRFKLSLKSQRSTPTKRSILSDIASLFDPLGWLAPCIIVAKILMQQLWLLGIGWDDPLPEDVGNDWLHYRNNLFLFEDLVIDRWIGYSSNCEVEFHAFCDASTRAYGAVIYARIQDQHGNVQISLLTSKTRVAPVKTVTVPRLELCGAALLAKLVKKLDSTFEFRPIQVYAWSDSTVVLSWIRKPPSTWKVFVANRVAQIQEATNISQWRYIKSELNPADCISRGIDASELQHHSLWWFGPPWLRLPYQSWPTTEHQAFNDLVDVAPIHVSTVVLPWDILEKYSTLSKLVRVTAWCRRFIINFCATWRPHQFQRINGSLTPKELQKAELFWVHSSQQQYFAREINLLSNGKMITAGKLKSLNPFLDADGLIRVGGRLRQSLSLSYCEKHPLVLEKSNTLTQLIIKRAHFNCLHGGLQLTLGCLRQKYWVLSARSQVRKIIHFCIKCFRQNPAASHQMMADLPNVRITPARPFLHTGVDYAGPILIRVGKGRGSKSQKAYIALYVCFSTKAVHIEPVTDYTTEAFLSSFRRFVSRRGLCSDLYSDCGTNFIGANNELRKSLCRAKIDYKFIADEIANYGTQWHFNPPAAPHFGGLWEAGVKCAKIHLKRVIGETILTFEELATLLSQIEASMNSRPLGALTSDPSDLRVLTPAHFLIGEPLLAVPEPNLLDVNTNRLSKWQHVQKMYQHFWQRWSSEYLHQLQQRPKWRRPVIQAEKGNLVIIIDNRFPPTRWHMGRIQDVHQGADGLVRVVSIKTKGSIIKRPVTKICLLPLENLN